MTAPDLKLVPPVDAQAAPATTAATTGKGRKRRKPGEKVRIPEWPHGYIRHDAQGRPTFIVEKRLGARRWHFSLHVHTIAAALHEVQRFEADPDTYLAGRGRDNALRFTEELREAFFKWSAEERHNTAKWTAEQKRYLAWWVEQLGDGCDLRRVDLGRDVIPALDATPCRAPKIAVLKCFYAWLRTERHIIEPTEDPTFGRLKVPQNDPAQWKKLKAFTRQQFDKVREKIGSELYRDAMTVQAGTGWHTTEAVQFARAGAVEPVPPGTDNAAGDVVLLCPLAKSGEPLRTRVSKEVGEAAKRLRAAGTLNRKNYDTAMREANKAAGLEVGTVSGGRFRHSVATWAIDSGATPAATSAFLGHKSQRTTRKFYATHAVPAKIPTLV